MTKNELINEYFEWMVQLVCKENHSKRLSYRKLLMYLHAIDFTYILSMDRNRSEDGVDLRYQFGYERQYSESMITAYLDDMPCSVLEMMVALALRCESDIMNDPEVGDRTSRWFWNMVSSLGLSSMTDTRFDRAHIKGVIRRFLNREYDRNGAGGLFTIERCANDLRTAEIWYQMCWYLDSIV